MSKQQLQDNITKIENMLNEYFLNELLEEFIRVLFSHFFIFISGD